MSDDILMFFDGHLSALPIYEKLESELLMRFPGTVIEVRKTQISFKTAVFSPAPPSFRPSPGPAAPTPISP